MAFSDDDKEKVRQATSIVDLIGEVTTVKRSGRNQMAVCPFHQEKTPSMSIDAARGLYYCHGCHAKGDVFTFVQENQGLTFPEALEALARRAGITLEEDPAATRRRGARQRLVDAVGQAVDHYHSVLMGSPEAGHARAYLRSRGYDAATVEDFKLGYSPPAGGSLVRELRARGIDERVLIEAGLARRGGGGVHDYFRDRVLFPTFDVRGDPVGFGGRILGDGQPKYLNTPETPIYKKSHLLYGLDRARREIQREGYAVVVEGYTDVIALHRAGLPVAVATNGTALGDDHFELLRRFCDRIVLAFDADAAGGRAALRGDELSIPVDLDLDLRMAAMPAGVDPADMVQQGRVDELRADIEHSTPLLQYRLQNELDRHDLREPESRARALKAVGTRLARVDDEVTRTEYARFVADRLGVDLATVERAVGRRVRPGRGPLPRSKGSTEPVGRRRRAEEELLRTILADSAVARTVAVDVEDFGGADTRAAFEAIRVAAGTVNDDRPVPLPEAEPPVAELLVRLTMDPRPPSPVEEALHSLRTAVVDERIDELERRLAALDPAEQSSSPMFEDLVRLQTDRRRLEGGST